MEPTSQTVHDLRLTLLAKRLDALETKLATNEASMTAIQTGLFDAVVRPLLECSRDRRAA